MHMTASRRTVLCGCLAGFVTALVRPVRADEAKPRLVLRELAKGTWIHTSWKKLKDVGYVPSNGLVVVGRDTTWLIDTAWEDEDTDQLFDEAKRLTGQAPSQVVVSAARDDSMSGLAVLHAKGVHSLAYELTNKDARAHDLMPAQESWSGTSAERDVGGRKLQLFYPGPAWSRDNTVMYLPDVAVLFGGGMIRAKASKDLGNVVDADIAAWPASVRAVQKRFGKARIVVPGHGEPGDASLLTHTIALAQAAQSSVKK
jgi:metallo-beta-lactamase class B